MITNINIREARYYHYEMMNEWDCETVEDFRNNVIDIAESENLSPEWALALSFLKGENDDVLEALANNPATHAEVLNDLLTWANYDANYSLLYAVLSNPNTSSETLYDEYDEDDMFLESLSLSIVENPNVPTDLAYRIIGNGSLDKETIEEVKANLANREAHALAA